VSFLISEMKSRAIRAHSGVKLMTKAASMDLVDGFRLISRTFTRVNSATEKSMDLAERYGTTAVGTLAISEMAGSTGKESTQRYAAK